MALDFWRHGNFFCRQLFLQACISYSRGRTCMLSHWNVLHCRYVSAHACVHALVCVRACVRASVCACVCICVRVCVYVWLCVCICTWRHVDTGCGHCKKLKPEFAAAATAVKKTAVLAAMDIDLEEAYGIRQMFNISGFPTLIYFE